MQQLFRVNPLKIQIRYQKMSNQKQLRSQQVTSNRWLYLVTGQAKIQINQQVYYSEGMALCYITKGSELSIYEVIDTLEYYVITHIEEALFINQYHDCQDVFQLKAVIEQWYQLQTCTTVKEQMLSQSCFYQFLYHYLDIIEMHNTKQNITISTRVKQYIESHYMQPLTRAKIAHYFNYNTDYLAAQFKKQAGKSLIDYVIERRLIQARYLLKHTQHTITEVSRQVGYEDVAYFTRLFKKQYDETPYQFRLEHQKVHYLMDSPITSILSSNDWALIWRYIDNDYQSEGESDMNTFTKTALTCFMACMLIVLAGCGDKKEEKQDETKEETVTYASSHGDIQIPKHPKRVVTDYYAGYLVALGVKPVGSRELYLQSPYLKEQIEGIALIEDSAELVVDLKPDLIIIGEEEKYEIYSKVAPTIVLTDLQDLSESVKEFGVILGKEKEADEWLKTYDERVMKARESVADIMKDKTTSVMDSGDGKGSIALYGNGYTGRSFYEGMNLQAPESLNTVVTKEKAWEPVSKEVLNEYAGDYVFVAVDKSADQFIKYDEELPWRDLPAIKENNLFEVDGYRFWFSDPVSLIGQVEDVAKMIQEHDTNRLDQAEK